MSLSSTSGQIQTIFHKDKINPLWPHKVTRDQFISYFICFYSIFTYIRCWCVNKIYTKMSHFISVLNFVAKNENRRIVETTNNFIDVGNRRRWLLEMAIRTFSWHSAEINRTAQRNSHCRGNSRLCEYTFHILCEERPPTSGSAWQTQRDQESSQS